MKKIIFLLFFFLNFEFCYANNNFAYININYILNNSIVGKSINQHLKNIREKKIKEFESIEINLSEKEKNILKKKNIIDKDEFNKEVNVLKNEINDYRKNKKMFNTELDKKKIEYSKKILKTLNSIISKYVEENSIEIVFSKKDVIIAKKDLDITDPIMKLLDNQLVEIDF